MSTPDYFPDREEPLSPEDRANDVYQDSGRLTLSPLAQSERSPLVHVQFSSLEEQRDRGHSIDTVYDPFCHADAAEVSSIHLIMRTATNDCSDGICTGSDI